MTHKQPIKILAVLFPLILKLKINIYLPLNNLFYISLLFKYEIMIDNFIFLIYIVIKKEGDIEMENENKQKNTTLIVVIVILSIVIIALMGGIIFLALKDNNIEMEKQAKNEVENIEQPLEESNVLSQENSNNITNDQNTNTITPPVTNNSGEARESSITNPLQIGEWGIASKYNTNTKGDQNVNIRVTNVIRGEEAKKMAKDYMSSGSSIYKYEDPTAYLEWAVIEYDVDFGNTFQMGELGANPNVNGDITGLDGTSIKYNGITYISSVIEIGSRDYIKTKTGSGKLLTQLPIGCTDYLIQFGTYNGTNAYIRGK